MNKTIHSKSRVLTAAILVAMGISTTLFSCRNSDNNNISNSGQEEVIYINSDDPNGNTIIAYRHAYNGVLTPLAGSPFSTAGIGIANTLQLAGVDEADGQMFITDDNFLLAVNSGSNTIAVMRIANDGTLTPVAGSPFPSGGDMPVSVYEKDGLVYVVNKSQNPNLPASNAPNYAVMTMANDGTLSLVENGIYSTNVGSSPTQALVSPSGRVLFGTDHLGYQLTPKAGTLRSFLIDGTTLLPTQFTPLDVPNGGGAKGLAQHPAGEILYVGFPTQGRFGIYNVNVRTGELTYTNSVDAGPSASWMRTTKAGDRLYVLNPITNSVTYFNTTTPSSPVNIGSITLKNSGPIHNAAGVSQTSSQAYSEEFSRNEKYLYVLSQHTNPDYSIGNYNYLHTLQVTTSGQLTETGLPVQLPVPNTVRPGGIVTFKIK